jgi:hypothetical protein
MTEPDFRLDAFVPADDASELAGYGVWGRDLTVLAEHHTADRTLSYFIAHDASATWGVPGSPQLFAIKITRDLDQRTYTFEAASHAGLAFAQKWLIERGCPPEPIVRTGVGFVQPADDATQRIEYQVRESGDRYAVLDTYTLDASDDDAERWTMVRDSRAVQAPIRIVLEDFDLHASTYTVREGAFSDEDAARDWLDNRSTPLPQPPEDRSDADGLRTRIALTRSGGTARATACGLDTGTVPSTAMAQQPSPGRSL